MKIYIAGKITGEPLEACQEKFAEAEYRLTQMGLAPVNPFKLGIPHHFSFTESKPYNFKALRHCSAIFMMKDWRKSPGAKVELQEAMRLKLHLYFEEAGDYQVLEKEFEKTTMN